MSDALQFLQTLQEFSRNDTGEIEEIYVGADTLTEEIGLELKDVERAGKVCAAVGIVRRERYKSVGWCYCLNTRMNPELAKTRIETLDNIADDSERGVQALIDGVLEGEVNHSVLSDEHEARNRAQEQLFKRERE